MNSPFRSHFDPPSLCLSCFVGKSDVKKILHEFLNFGGLIILPCNADLEKIFFMEKNKIISNALG